MNGTLTLAPEIAPKVDEAVAILRGLGATEVYVFGSAVTGRWTERSDLDLAVRGLPPRLFYRAVGKLLLGLKGISVDLLDLEDGSRFAEYILTRGRLLRVG